MGHRVTTVAKQGCLAALWSSARERTQMRLACCHWESGNRMLRVTLGMARTRHEHPGQQTGPGWIKATFQAGTSLANTRRTMTIVQCCQEWELRDCRSREAPWESLRHPYGPSSLSLKALPFTLYPELRLELYPSNDTGG